MNTLPRVYSTRISNTFIYIYIYIYKGTIQFIIIYECISFHRFRSEMKNKAEIPHCRESSKTQYKNVEKETKFDTPYTYIHDHLHIYT